MFDSIGVATTNGTGSRFNRLKSCDKRLIAVCVAILTGDNENMTGKGKVLTYLLGLGLATCNCSRV